MHNISTRAGNTCATCITQIVGFFLSILLSGIALIRKDKPIHTKGDISDGVWKIEKPAGIQSSLFDDLEEKKVICRRSRSLSLGTKFDIMGIALRFTGDDAKEKIDLLFVTTGEGRYSKYIPKFHKDIGDGTYTTILPMQCSDGLVWFRLKKTFSHQYSIAFCREREPWDSIGKLSLDPGPFIDQRIRFDPISSLPDGLTLPAWIKALRSPSYRLARLAVQTDKKSS